MPTTMYDKMDVIFTKPVHLWLADHKFVDELYQYYFNLKTMPEELLASHMWERRAMYLGYDAGASYTGPMIPAGTRARIRRYDCLTVSVPLEPPAWIYRSRRDKREAMLASYYNKHGKIRTTEVIVTPGEDISEFNVVSKLEWWAIYIQMWPVDKYYRSTDRMRQKYIRGIGLVGDKDKLPDYLEPLHDREGE